MNEQSIASADQKGAGTRRRAGEPGELSQALLEISRLFESSAPLDGVLERIAAITAELMQMPICSIYLIEEDEILRKRSNVGLKTALSRQATFKVGEGIPGWVALHGEFIALADITKDPRYANHPSPIMTPHAYICAPLRSKERVLGVLSARARSIKEFTATECRVFETVAQMIAQVIRAQRLVEERLRNQHLTAVVTSLSGIAHYVKNVMFTEAVAEKTVGRVIEGENSLEKIQPAWRNLKRANQRIRKLVEDMLTYSRERDPQLEATDLEAMVRGTVEDLHDHAAKHNVSVDVDVDPGVGTVHLDPSIVSDVLLNLITNAIDAIPQDRTGHVCVRTRSLSGGETYAIEVQDNGAGIPPDVQDKIFTLFFSTKGGGGTGIGLAATRKAVEKLGGEVSFTTKQNEGSLFRVVLPRMPSLSVPDVVT